MSYTVYKLRPGMDNRVNILEVKKHHMALCIWKPRRWTTWILIHDILRDQLICNVLTILKHPYNIILNYAWSKFTNELSHIVILVIGIQNTLRFIFNLHVIGRYLTINYWNVVLNCRMLIHEFIFLLDLSDYRFVSRFYYLTTAFCFVDFGDYLLLNCKRCFPSYFIKCVAMM